MKLGTQTGSLVNHLHSRSVKGQPEPEVGMGATILCYTDRRAATVVAWDGKILTVCEDHAKRVDGNGMSESQRYEFSPNPNGYESNFRKNKNGMWEEVVRNPETGRWNKTGGYGLLIGRRDHYRDFSF